MSESTYTLITPWADALTDSDFKRYLLKKVLPDYMVQCRWYGAKNAQVKSRSFYAHDPYSYGNKTAHMLFIEVFFQTAYSENYFLPIALVADRSDIDDKWVLAEMKMKGKQVFMVDALATEDFRNSLFLSMLSNESVPFIEGTLVFQKGRKLKRVEPQSVLLDAEQSNTTVVYNDRYFLKIYRKLFRDRNPDHEITHHLSERANYKNSPAFTGSITWARRGKYDISLGLMQEKVENQGTAWDYMLAQTERYFNNIERRKLKIDEIPKVDLYKRTSPDQLPLVLLDLIGIETLTRLQKLAQRTAEMHGALFNEKIHHAFVPTNFTEDYRVWLLNRLMYQFDSRISLLENTFDKLDGQAAEWARIFFENKEKIKDILLDFDQDTLNSQRIRIHGDYHLGQILVSESDFYILDFEGEPESTIRDRKVKQPPIKDVAGLFRSFHYAVFATLFNRKKSDGYSEEELFDAGGRYYRAVVAVFLDAYIQKAFDSGIDIGYYQEIDFLLRYHILEKAIYELGYELNSRPNWVVIPLKGIMQILNND